MISNYIHGYSAVEQQRLLKGLAHLQAIPDHPDGVMATIVYRAQARKTN